MTFARPELLALAALAALLATLGVAGQWRRSIRLVAAFGGPEAAARLTPSRLERLPVGRLVALALATAALGVGAAGPQPAVEPPVGPERIDLVVAVDLSLSMAAEDVGTSRAGRANDAVIRLAEALPDERLGLDVFAGWPYTLVPPTADAGVVTFFGATMAPGAVGDRDQGTTLSAALLHAREALELRRRPEARAGILLISDGEGYEERGSLLAAVDAATVDGVTLWVAGVGTEGGTVLYRAGSTGEPLVDDVGLPVVARLDAELLREIARAGGGSYHAIGTEAGLSALLADIAGTRTPEDGGGGLPPLSWLLAVLALPLLVLEGTLDARRRGAVR